MSKLDSKKKSELIDIILRKDAVEQEKSKVIDTLNKAIENFTKKVASLEEINVNLRNNADYTFAECTKHVKTIESLTEELNEKKELIESIEEANKVKNKSIVLMQQDVSNLRKIITERDDELANLRKEALKYKNAKETRSLWLIVTSLVIIVMGLFMSIK